MKIPPLLRFIPVVVTSFVASGALAQEVSLGTNTVSLNGGGDVVTLSAAFRYDQRPAAIGWVIEGTAVWELVSVGGENPPDVAPAPATSGPLEFAYTNPPDRNGQFTVTVRFPAGTRSTAINGRVIFRLNDKRWDITAPPIVLPKD